MALPPGPPELAAVDQGRLPRGSSVSLRWIRISGNDSPLFAPAVHPGKDARQRAQLGPCHRNTRCHWQNRTSANNIYGAATQFRHEYARLAAYRKEENSSPNPHKQPLGSSYRPEYRAILLGNPLDCCLRRIILEAR